MYETSQLSLVTWLAYNGIWPDRVVRKDGQRHFFFRYPDRPEPLLQEWAAHGNVVRKVLNIYHYCRRQGQNAEAADLIEALFEQPNM